MLLLARDEDGEPMGDGELRDELITLLLAGHETTATTLAWAFELLARHPAAWERVAREALGGEPETPYIDAVIQETLRLRPVLPLVVRRITAPVTVGQGRFRVPAGTRLAPAILLVHRRADVYPEPEAFRPERFLGEPPGTYTWIPFGGGMRRCVGAAFSQMEMRQVLRVAAARAAIAPAGPPERTGRRGFMLVPREGGRVRVKDVVPAPAAAMAREPEPEPERVAS
jgi:cytochrome P450